MGAGWSAHRYLASRARVGIRFGLESMRTLLGEMGQPERAWPCLLVAGTNGKGSVCSYVAAALQASGLRTGLYTSPHLQRVHERIAVNGRPIAERALQTAVRAVRDAAQRLVERGQLQSHPTGFEVLTAAACEHFRRARVDVAVLEVGLGGRRDATGVVEPLASAIVTIDYDHQAWLGHTLASIAREKAGVLRPGRVTVLGPLPAVARRAIAGCARPLGARLLTASTGARFSDRDGRLDLETPRGSYPALRSLPGRHQRDNLLVAVRLLEAAADAGLPVDLARLGEATRRTRWPGRLQAVPGRPRLLLDGAHNPAGARALAAHLAGERPYVLLFGAMQDKDVRALAAPLLARAQQVVLTRPRLPRAASPAQLLARARGLGGGPRHLEPSVARAVRLARRLAGPDGLVVAAGSLFLVGEVLGLLERQRASARGR